VAGKGEVKNTSKERETKQTQVFQMGVSKNRGTPKWMVKILENPIV